MKKSSTFTALAPTIRARHALLPRIEVAAEFVEQLFVHVPFERGHHLISSGWRRTHRRLVCVRGSGFRVHEQRQPAIRIDPLALLMHVACASPAFDARDDAEIAGRRWRRSTGDDGAGPVLGGWSAHDVRENADRRESDRGSLLTFITLIVYASRSCTLAESAAIARQAPMLTNAWIAIRSSEKCSPPIARSDSGYGRSTSSITPRRGRYGVSG